MDIKTAVAEKVTEAINNSETETINSVSAKALIPYTSLYRKVKGQGEFTMTELGKIADVLGITPMDLMPQSFTSERAA